MESTERFNMAKIPESLTSSVPLKKRAAHRVRDEHDRPVHCDDLDVQSKEREDGEVVIYCGNCEHVLLSWGGE